MRRLLSTTALPLALFLAACDEPTPPSVASAEPPAAAPSQQPPPAIVTNDELAKVPAPPTTAPPTTSGGEAGVLRTVRFPNGELTVPVEWHPKVRNEPPMTAVHLIPVPAMTCDLAVLEGHGTPRQAEEYLAAGANAYNGETARAPVIEVGGHAFQGITIQRPKALPNSAVAVVEVYAAISGEDLVGIGITRLEPSPALDEGKKRCLEAFAQLTSKLPAAPADKPAGR